MLTGYVLLILANGQVMPVSEHLYPVIEACQRTADRLNLVRPEVKLTCGEVFRASA